MRVRTTVAIAAVAAGVGGGAGAGPAQASKTCTWGGTPAAPTGVTTNGGITNVPSPVPLKFWATGALGGDCRGRMRFRGQMDAGSSCALINFEGTVTGLRGVARFVGTSAMGVAPARLYDRRGKLVGSENAQFLTNSNLTDCSTPDGLRRVVFSSVVELFG